MKDKILMIAVAASAGYAGGKMGSAQAVTPDYLYAKEGIVVGDRSGAKNTRIWPDQIVISGARGASGPRLYLTVTEFQGKEEAMVILGGGGDSAPGVQLMAREEKAYAAVGLQDKNHIQIEYEHGSPSTILRVLTGGRARKLVVD
jgi:hypothetical protein